MTSSPYVKLSCPVAEPRGTTCRRTSNVPATCAPSVHSTDVSTTLVTTQMTSSTITATSLADVPNPTPDMVSTSPGYPEVGDSDVICGVSASEYVKSIGAYVTPFETTWRLAVPLLEADGVVQSMVVGVTAEMSQTFPSSVTLVELTRKPNPVTTMTVPPPTLPEVGLTLVMSGFTVTTVSTARPREWMTTDTGWTPTMTSLTSETTAPSVTDVTVRLTSPIITRTSPTFTPKFAPEIVSSASVLPMAVGRSDVTTGVSVSVKLYAQLSAHIDMRPPPLVLCNVTDKFPVPAPHDFDVTHSICVSVTDVGTHSVAKTSTVTRRIDTPTNPSPRTVRVVPPLVEPARGSTLNTCGRTTNLQQSACNWRD